MALTVYAWAPDGRILTPALRHRGDPDLARRRAAGDRPGHRAAFAAGVGVIVRWVRTPRGRVAVLVAVYFVALAWAFVARVAGSAFARLAEYVLIIAGLLLIVLVGVPRRPVRLRVAGCWAAVYGPSLVMFVALLVGLGTALGILAGLGAGVLVLGALLWLRGVAAIVRNPRIMITYRPGRSSPTVDRLRAALQGAYGARNIDDIGPVRLTRSELGDRLRDKDALFVVIGPSWLDLDGDGVRRIDRPQDKVRQQIEAAFAAGVPVVPLLVDGAAVPRAEHLPPSLRPLPAMHGYAIADGAAQDASVRDAVERSRDVVAPRRPLSRRSVTRRRLVVVALAAVVLLPVAWEGVELWTEPMRGAAAAAVAPDGRSVVTAHVVGGRTIVHRWNPETGAVEASRAVAGWAEPHWSPDGRTIAADGQGETVQLHDAVTLAPVRAIPGAGSVLGWSADGAWLLTTTRGRTVHLVRAATGERVASTTPLGTAGFAAVDWSAATSRLALSSGATITVLGVGADQLRPTDDVGEPDRRQAAAVVARRCLARRGRLRAWVATAALCRSSTVRGPAATSRTTSRRTASGSRPTAGRSRRFDLWGAVRVFDVATGALRSEVEVRPRCSPTASGPGSRGRRRLGGRGGQRRLRPRRRPRRPGRRADDRRGPHGARLARGPIASSCPTCATTGSRCSTRARDGWPSAGCSPGTCCRGGPSPRSSRVACGCREPWHDR